MIPWTGKRPLTSAAIEVFNGLRGEALEKAIATGNYDALLKQTEREPGQDDEPLDDPFARAMGEDVRP